MEFNKPSTLDVNGDIASNFAAFKEEVQIYLVATETVKKSREVQVARLKNLLGSDGLKLYNTLSNGSKEETINSILEVLENHCKPKQNLTMDIYKLLCRNQLPEESFEHFYADLRKLIQPCAFQEQEEKIMKALIALGVNSREMQQKLLREDACLEKVVNFCKSVELADKNLKLINRENETKGVVDAVNHPSTSTAKSRYNLREKSQQIKNKSCFRCGREHSGVCPALGKICNYCSKPNHFSNVCRLKRSRPANEISYLENQSPETECLNSNLEPNNTLDKDHEINSLYLVSSLVKKNSWCKELLVNGEKMNLKLDSGADVNILPFHLLAKYNIPYKSLEKCYVQLEAYGGFRINPIGCVTVPIESDSKISLTKFLVVKNRSSVPILGLQSCVDLNLIKRLDSVDAIKSERQAIYDQNRDVFDGLGCFPDVYRIKLQDNALPTISPARRIPFKIKDRFRETLDSLKLKGIITPVEEPVDWINNVVIVEKPDGSLRLCIDPIELNKYIVRERYVIPTIDELAPNLSHKKVFTVLDIKDAFYHIALDEESSKLCSFSTVFGTFRFLRAPFGLLCLPELFQRLVHKYFGDIKGVSLYFDDLCIASDSKDENDKILREVLQRAKQFNVKFNFNKFQYCVSQVKYVGVIFCEQGMLPDPDKIETIKKLENPKNKPDLQRMLGMVNYLRHFIPNMSELVSPLRKLLRKDVAWHWNETHTQVFQKLKQVLCSPQVLAAFDPTTPIEIQCDASKDALGFCMLQKGKPLYFSSRSMTTTEESYAQVEKELLAICFSVQKLHNFIYGHDHVTVFTDHLPLVSLMSKSMDKILNNRLKRLKLKLINYRLNVKYLPGKYMFIADFMSRTGIKTKTIEDQTMKDFIHTLGSTDISMSEPMLKDFQNKTKSDETLMSVTSYLYEGWPDMKEMHGDMKHMYRLRNDLQLSNGLIYYGTRLIVPTTLRRLVLSRLHETHLGSSKMLSLVDQFYYWPGIYSDVRNLVLSCGICQKYYRSNSKEPLINHELPEIPFSKVAADIAEIKGQNYLVVIDYFSRWLEVYQIHSKNSSTIIKKFKEIFSRFGIPKTLIADNMPFNSFEMQQFAKDWQFEIVTSSPYHPKSNGLVEKAVGIFKTMFKKASENKQDLDLYLMNYRNAPVAGLQHSPSQLLNSRVMRTKLPINGQVLKPKLVSKDIQDEMKDNQRQQKTYYDRRSIKNIEEFFVGQDVLVQNICNKQWEKARIIEKLPQPRSYLLKHINGSIQRRNSIHIRKLNKHNLDSMREEKIPHNPEYIVHSRIVTPSHDKSQSTPNIKPDTKRGRC
jgi:hypothetical protein